MDLKKELTQIAKNARQAAQFISNLDTAKKNRILEKMARNLEANKAKILMANKKDIALAKAAKLSGAFIDRLSLNEKRMADMVNCMLNVAKLNDPVGEEIKSWQVPSGLDIHKVRVPIGVIAIIYEARPNVTADCIGLTFKAGNSVILKGGSEALNSNAAILSAINEVVKKNDLPEGAINIITSKNRRAIDILLKLNDYIDLVIPRGGEGLIKKVVNLSRIPVIKHYKGICHVYVDDYADLNMAERVCFNAKVQRPGVCNAMESMLVHRDVAARFLPRMLKRFKEAKVQIRGCPITQRIGKEGIVKATDKDYRSEYADLILAVKVLKS